MTTQSYTPNTSYSKPDELVRASNAAIAVAALELRIVSEQQTPQHNRVKRPCGSLSFTTSPSVSVDVIITGMLADRIS